MMLEKILRPAYRLLVKSGVIKLFVNKVTKRSSLTAAYYMYKTGLIPYNPTRPEVRYKYKTKIKIKKVVEKPGFITPNDVNPLVPSGSLITGGNSSTPPVVLFDARDILNPERYVDKVAQLQLVTFGFKPIFITNNPDFSCLRKYGYLFEYLPNETLFSRVQTPLSYDTFVNHRIVEIIALHRPKRMLSIKDVDLYLQDFINPANNFR